MQNEVIENVWLKFFFFLVHIFLRYNCILYCRKNIPSKNNNIVFTMRKHRDECPCSPRQTSWRVLPEEKKPMTFHWSSAPPVFWLAAAGGSQSTLFPPVYIAPDKYLVRVLERHSERRCRHPPFNQRKGKIFYSQKCFTFKWTWLGNTLVVLLGKIGEPPSISLLCYIWAIWWTDCHVTFLKFLFRSLKITFVSGVSSKTPSRAIPAL